MFREIFSSVKDVATALTNDTADTNPKVLSLEKQIPDIKFSNAGNTAEKILDVFSSARRGKIR